ncbi:ParB/RepB/Spo0J family partition protein [Pseudomonadota bacterium]
MSDNNKNTKQTQKLGRGLSSLLGEYKKTNLDSSVGENNIIMLDSDLIFKGNFQPRKTLADSELEDLANSIKEHGILQPILIRSIKETQTYEIIAGERRFQASKIAGFKEVPVIIKNMEDKDALALAIIENVQREDLSPMEEALGYKRLAEEFNYTQNDISQKVGKSRSHISNLLRLLTLPDEVQTMIDENIISIGHAKLLVGNDDALKIAREIAKNSLNVRDTEKLIAKQKRTATKIEKQKNTDKTDLETISLRKEYVKEAEKSIKNKYGWNTNIKYNIDKDKGQIVIKYKNLDDLDKIIQDILG